MTDRNQAPAAPRGKASFAAARSALEGAPRVGFYDGQLGNPAEPR